MKRNVLLLVVLLEAACLFLICWFTPRAKAAEKFNNASITITGKVELTLATDTQLKSQGGANPLNLKTGDKVRVRRLTNNSVEFYGDETKDYQGKLPLESFDETDRINELLAPARNAEEFRREDYLDSCMIKIVVVCADYLAIMGGLCLLASVKHEWMGFALNIVLVAVFVVFVLAFKTPITEFLF